MLHTEQSIEMATLESEILRFKHGLPYEKYNQWMDDVAKRAKKHPFEEHRIGWISRIPQYSVCCCGQSLKDLSHIISTLLLLVILFLFFLLFYGANTGFLWIIWSVISMNFVLTLYSFGIIGFVFYILLITFICINEKQLESRYLESLS